MFTGLIEEIGCITAIKQANGNRLLTIKAAKVLQDLKIGDSISVNGVCLTVVERDDLAFKVEATAGTIAGSNLGQWTIGRRVNLERALKVGDRLGGHLVQGHIDGVGKVSRIQFRTGMNILKLEITEPVSKFIVSKGSVAIDGVSLTVAEKWRDGFSVMLIPHTLENTTLSELRPGMTVNIETDIFLRWLSEYFSEPKEESRISIEESGWFNIYRED